MSEIWDRMEAARSLQRLVQRRREIVREIALWMRQWDEAHRKVVGLGDAFAGLPSFEDEARAAIPIAIAEEARVDADIERAGGVANWVASLAASAEPTPTSSADPPAADRSKPCAS